ncbi:MAG: hypothetical protein EBR88_08670, partial [Betaproteobacteria bacterium]|nr:hypothetical protein [Betaproteobacteria bacterium]
MRSLPLQGIRVIEFSHMVMGPFCGMVLADLGAEVIKVEPLDGDKTRSLPGSGAGFFAAFNRNKKSVTLDLKSEMGRQTALALLASADVGVAMGLSGSDIATNSAGVALMNDDLRSIPFLLELARKAKGIVAVNIAASLLL